MWREMHSDMLRWSGSIQTSDLHDGHICMAVTDEACMPSTATHWVTCSAAEQASFQSLLPASMLTAERHLHRKRERCQCSSQRTRLRRKCWPTRFHSSSYELVFLNTPAAVFRCKGRAGRCKGRLAGRKGRLAAPLDGRACTPSGIMVQAPTLQARRRVVTAAFTQPRLISLRQKAQWPPHKSPQCSNAQKG